jgi:hypothetical protein
MIITLSPVSPAPATVATVSGDILTIDGVPYDLSVIPEGAEATDDDADSPFIGPIRRVGGQIVCTIVYGYDMATAEPVQSTDLADYTFEVASGPVPDPIRRKPSEPTPEDAA